MSVALATQSVEALAGEIDHLTELKQSEHNGEWYKYDCPHCGTETVAVKVDTGKVFTACPFGCFEFTL